MLSSGHLSSSPSSSSHYNVFTTPYSFTPLPLTPYDSEQTDPVFDSTRSWTPLAVVKFGMQADKLLSRPVRDPSRQDIDAQFTTLVGDTPDRVVSTAGDNFRAGVRALRLGGPKGPAPVRGQRVPRSHDDPRQGQEDAGETPAGQLHDKGKKRAMSALAGTIEERLLGKVVPFESTPDVFVPGEGLERGGTVVSRVAA
ncbi:hypothetical protein JVU11DRAFT_1303 [Chiua virens]|nr:hypothetical protein JVU11DRAFT_1303 [Chiua virens]